MPRWHSDLDLRLPHPRGGLDGRAGAGLHAGQRVRLRRAGACRRARRRRVRAAAVVLLQRPHRLLRGDRQVPRRPAHLGPLDARALRRQPERGRCSCASTRRPPACRSPRSSPRSTSSGPRSRRSPACSAARSRCTPTRWTRRWRCRPRRRPASRCAPSRCIAYETNVANVADPLGGSWFVESLTDEMERQAEEIFAHLDELGDGSMLEGVHPRASRRTGSRAEIADSAYELERKFNAGPADRRRRQPASPRATTTTRSSSSQITNEDEARQLKRLDQVRHDRDQAAVDAALARLAAEAADPERQPDADADRHGRRPTPPSARSCTRWPTSSAGTSRRPRSDPAPARRRPVRSRASPTVGMGTVDPCPPPVRSRPDRGR